MRNRVVQWCTWAACALACAGAVVSLVVTAEGANREGRVALPLAIAAAALASSALTWRRSGWLGGLLYAVAALTVLYATILALSLPVRLAVEGTCSAAPTPCPLGFERPATPAETFAMYSAVIAGAAALLLIFAAVEARYLRTRPRPLP